MELVIDLWKLKKSGIFTEEFILLQMINEGVNYKEYSFGLDTTLTLKRLEQFMWIKATEDGYILRDKGRQLFESKHRGDVVTKVIEYLNEKTKRKYSIKTVANRKFIIGRLSEGYTEEDLKAVIDTMCSK